MYLVRDLAGRTPALPAAAPSIADGWLGVSHQLRNVHLRFSTMAPSKNYCAL